MATIGVLGTFDTKGEELAFVAEVIRGRGHGVLLIDVGTLGAARVTVDVTREEVATAGGIDLAGLMAEGDRGKCVAAIGQAAAFYLARIVKEGRIDGVISLGGGGGTAIGSAAMRPLLIGFPKLMVSTLASGNTAAYVGTSDLVMFPSVVDIAGLNRISRLLLTRAAGAICGMVESGVDQASDKPVIVASMFGNTTTCVQEARRVLEEAGYEVLVMHATGVGGRRMESLIESGLAVGVLDVTTTEWADELVGGVLSAGPTRLDAAAKAKVPAVVVPGCLDMVNFGERQSVPAKFSGRLFYQHNPQVTLMRTTLEECAQLGRILAEKVNAYAAPTTVLLPLRGISVIAAEGQPFYDPVADAALFDAIRNNLQSHITLVELDCNINDMAFARACASALLKNIGA